jgi:hypothetical protein
MLGGSANHSLSAVRCRHYHEEVSLRKALWRVIFCFYSTPDVMTAQLHCHREKPLIYHATSSLQFSTAIWAFQTTRTHDNMKTNYISLDCTYYVGRCWKKLIQALSYNAARCVSNLLHCLDSFWVPSIIYEAGACTARCCCTNSTVHRPITHFI